MIILLKEMILRLIIFKQENHMNFVLKQKMLLVGEIILNLIDQLHLNLIAVSNLGNRNFIELKTKLNDFS
jgi:hypothetical protein